MTNEKEFERAKEIEEYVWIIEKEIMDLMDYLPPTEPYVKRKEKKTKLGGWIMRIFKRDNKTILKAQKNNSEYSSKEFELTNDDIMGLVHSRSLRQQELIAEFKDLTGIEINTDALYESQRQEEEELERWHNEHYHANHNRDSGNN